MPLSNVPFPSTNEDAISSSPARLPPPPPPPPSYGAFCASEAYYSGFFPQCTGQGRRGVRPAVSPRSNRRGGREGRKSKPPHSTSEKTSIAFSSSSSSFSEGDKRLWSQGKSCSFSLQPRGEEKEDRCSPVSSSMFKAHPRRFLSHRSSLPPGPNRERLREKGGAIGFERKMGPCAEKSQKRR